MTCLQMTWSFWLLVKSEPVSDFILLNIYCSTGRQQGCWIDVFPFFFSYEESSWKLPRMCVNEACILRWLNTVLAVSEYRSFAKSWQEKGCSSQAETWQVKNILMKDFDWQVKFDVFVVSMATWTIEYNLKISLLLSLHKICPIDFPIN